MSTDLLTRQTLAEQPGGARAYLSASRLSLWLRCPLAWRFRYLDGVEVPVSPAAFLGKVVHHGLELFYRHRQLGIALDAGDLLGRLREAWAELVDEERMRFASVEDEQKLHGQAEGLVSAYLGQFPTDEPRPLAVEVALEAPLVDPASGDDLGLPLVGILDLVLDAPQGPLIVDFKTTARSSEPAEIQHELQLTAYAWLLRQLAVQPEAGLEIRAMVKTKTPKVERHRYSPRTPRHFRRFFAVVREYLEALDVGRFNYRPGWGCATCEYREKQCRMWPG